MAGLKLGDKVRIRDRSDWPSPPGFRLANAEGTIVKWIEYEKPMEDFKDDYVYVHIEKAGGEGQVYIGNCMFFRVEDVEKIF
ncbi:hypothetical protein [Moorella sulfitireducens (nom. illeg.)]|uniref:hypothetical protein n=1 Tax=Neomoorella sulfitireducens TaxID=2972948 RepID=UPI0021AD2AA0|nr:hypothetical protein [Moorella sulfitireducens]